ncbi:MAG: DUF2147 domain-containing protein [Gammaproteobacteria bacterium]|nr:DUF2147 domain-containing protein [Gammaproteobacteria bacterium]
MKKVALFLLIITGIFLSITRAFAEAPTTLAQVPSPVGSWQTIDDVSKTPRSIVQISLDGQQLIGKLVKINYRHGEGPNDLCIKCTGDLHNQKILGMTILTGFTQSPSNPLIWRDGKIVDPESGKTYDCKITLSEDGKQMKVRGYIIFSLFGRTQYWYRT